MTDASDDTAPATGPADPAAATDVPAFLAARTGPFYDLQVRFGLLDETDFNAGRRAALYIAVAWLVPLILTLPGNIPAGSGARSYLSDPVVWSMCVVGIGAFILADRQIEIGLKTKLAELSLAPLLSPAATGELGRLAGIAQRRCASGLAEAVCLVLSYLACIHYAQHLHRFKLSTWEVIAGPDGARVTPAGWWIVLVSTPLFSFLLLRGLWRHAIWSWLMMRLSRMPLRLVASHPDGHAGLGFIGRYPNAYSTFVFGASIVVAAKLASLQVSQSVSLGTFSLVTGAWLVIVLAVFGTPLLAFGRPLGVLKLRGLTLGGAQATRYQRQAERKALGVNVVAEGPDEDDEAGDPAKVFDAHRKLSTLLVSRDVLLPMCFSALLPFAAFASTRLPYKEVWSIVKRLLLL